MTVSIIKPNGETVVSFGVKSHNQGKKVARSYINRHVLPTGTKANIQ